MCVAADIKMCLHEANNLAVMLARLSGVGMAPTAVLPDGLDQVHRGKYYL
jgi:hypothetical protein